ncbi:hypothetical protein [Methylobacillus sp. Pita1]|uniref:hypothetical protein n=1 Tax=Methylobacillus sp. Pita1 TaxID=3382642 RepID=UPI0038B4EADA
MMPAMPTPPVSRKPGTCFTCCLATGLLMFLSTAHATGFEPLPISGVLLEHGSSAYTLCNATGKFDPEGRHMAPRKPTAEHSNACAIFPENEIAAPLPGFKLFKHANRQVMMNNSLTGQTDKKIASVMDVVWRNPAAGECIYGTRVLALSSADADYNAQLPGKQFFRITDIARGGFAGQDIEVAYAMYATGAEPVYRIGRSFTAVQYYKRPGYERQPLTEPAFREAINGVETTERAVPSFSQQTASLNDDWVNFTTLVGLPKRPASPMLYVKAPCNNETPAEQPQAIRLRQAIAPFVELSVPGFVPSQFAPSGLLSKPATNSTTPQP